MTTTSLEVKDGITEFLPQYDEITSMDEEESTGNSRNEHTQRDALLLQLEKINSKFDSCSNRIDKMESTRNYINLNEDPETLQCKALREYISTGNTRYSTGMEQKTVLYSDPSFSYLIPKKFVLHVDKLLYQNSVMRKLCSVEKISGGNFEYVVTDNKDTFVGWGAEKANIKPTRVPQFTTTTINLFEMYAQPQISQKLLEDSSINLEDWLITNLVEAFCRMENGAFINGDGDEKPLGIMGYTGLKKKKVHDASDQKEENKEKTNDIEEKTQHPSSIIEVLRAEKLDADSIIKLFYSLDHYYTSQASFLMNRSLLQEIRLLKYASGQYILQPGASGEELLMGIPVHLTPDMPLIDSTEYPAIAIADFKSAYKIVENKDIRVLRDPYTSKAFVKFYVTRRVGGAVVNKNAIKMLKIEAPKKTSR